MKYVALTGGIGSGKSHVARLLAARGIPLFEADAAAKRLMAEEPLRSQLVQAIGNEVFTPAGELNRPYLAQRAFTEPEVLSRLNALVHPAVHAASRAWFEAQRAENDRRSPAQRLPFAVHEAAIVFELGYADRYDAVVLVTAPEAVRLARVMARDGATAEQVQARMARQWPDTQKIPLATFVIENDGRPLEPQLEALWARLSAAPERP